MIPFFFTTEQYSKVYITIFSYSFLSCRAFWLFLAIVNIAAMHIAHKNQGGECPETFGHMPRVCSAFNQRDVDDHKVCVALLHPRLTMLLLAVDAFHRHHIWEECWLSPSSWNFHLSFWCHKDTSLQVGGTQVCSSSGNPSRGPEVHSVFSSGNWPSSWVYQGQQWCAVCFGNLLDNLDQQLKRGISLSDISNFC